MKNVVIIERKPSVVIVNVVNIDNGRIDGEFYNNKYIENENTLLNSGIKIESLNEVIETMNSPIGWQGIPSTSYLKHGEGIPLIRVQNVSDLILDEEKLIDVEENIYNEQPAIQAQANDIIITRVGTIGRVCRIPCHIDKIAMGQNLTRIKLKDSKVESGFMLAYMTSKHCQLQMQRHAYGGVQASLTNRNLRQLLIPIPSPEIQKYIGDKVRYAEMLRADAKRHKEDAGVIIPRYLGITRLDDFKRHSIVRVKALDIKDRIDSAYYHLKYLMIIEKLKERGYELFSIGSICSKVFNGSTYNTSSEKSTFMNIGVGELGEWFPDENNEKYINDKVNEKYVLKKNSIIWGNAAHLSKYIGEKVNIVLEESIYVPTTEVTAIEPDEEKVNPYFLFLFMNSEWGYYQIQRTVKGMTAHSYPQDIFNVLVPNIKLNIEEEELIKVSIEAACYKESLSKQLIKEAKQDIEDLIEGTFDMNKLDENHIERR